MKKRQSKGGKQGQIMGMSFQFIFSIILIAVAFFVAFWVIRHFMSIAEQGKILSFKEDFENRVESLWASAYEVDTPYTFSLSSKIKWVCFANKTIIPCNDPPPDYVPLFDLCLEEDWGCSSLCKEVSEDYNLYLLPLGMAEKYNAPSEFLVTCKGKNCLNFTNAECIPVKDGKVTVQFKKGGDVEPGKVRVSALPIAPAP